MSRVPRNLLGALLIAMAAITGCSSDDDPTGPAVIAPFGVTATPTGSSSIRVQFNSTAGDNSYEIERATGAAGAFAQLATVPAPATAGQVTHNDIGLTRTTQYRYRVIAVRGTARSAASSEVTATTTDIGAFGRDVTLDITAGQTWFADTVYTLKGFIHVTNGATLTIQAGTKIQGDFATLGSSLFILRGAKIEAIGTAALPIVFTSSRTAGQRQPGDWGGLIIVGNATNTRTGVDFEVEGTGTSVGNASGTNYRVNYSGGTTDTDNSGTLRYVRVEYAGYAPSPNNELNSFTFAAVGSGTSLSFLQSMAGLDDSFEWFGGTVNATNLVSYESGDDHFDMSEGFRGRLQFLIALQTTQLAQRTGAGSISSDPQGIENDGCPSSAAGCTLGQNTAPFTTPVVANFTLVGTGDLATSGSSGGVGMMIRRGSGGYYVNGIVSRWPRAGVSVRDVETYLRGGSVAIPDLATSDLATKNVLFTETATLFQIGGTSVQNVLDAAGNALTTNAATTASLFTAFPATFTDATTAAALDWTPPATSAAATGGLTTFTGKMATAAGTAVAGTAYVGAAQPGGTKWWAGWTVYNRK